MYHFLKKCEVRLYVRYTLEAVGEQGVFVNEINFASTCKGLAEISARVEHFVEIKHLSEFLGNRCWIRHDALPTSSLLRNNNLAGL